jgi:hypothetical protein
METLEACAEANPHGGGIAWRERGLVHYRKTDDPAEMRRLASQARGEVVIHFRIASVGGVSPHLRHPFLVTGRSGLSHEGTARAVLFQNGTWHGWVEAVERAVRAGHKRPAGPMSDARAAAWLTHVHGPDFLRDLTPSRWVLFTADTTIAHGQWRERGGIRFSNLHWCREDSDIPPHLVARSSAPQRMQTVDLWGGESRDYWARLRAACPK